MYIQICYRRRYVYLLTNETLLQYFLKIFECSFRYIWKILNTCFPCTAIEYMYRYMSVYDTCRYTIHAGIRFSCTYSQHALFSAKNQELTRIWIYYDFKYHANIVVSVKFCINIEAWMNAHLLVFDKFLYMDLNNRKHMFFTFLLKVPYISCYEVWGNTYYRNIIYLSIISLHN